MESVEYPEKLFFLGQVLKCKILDVTPEKRRMSLTLILTDEKMAPLGSKQKKMNEAIKKGFIYENIKICDKTSDGLGVEVNGIKALIPKNHLTDHVNLAEKLLNSFNINDVIPKALCFEKDVLPIFTLKHSIMSFEGSKTTFDDLHDGQIIPAVVSNIKPYGVFVKLPVWKMRKSCLIPLRHLTDIFVETPSDVVELNQTLYGKIIEKNEKEQKITMTSKSKEVLAGQNPKHILEITTSFFSDLELLKEHISHSQLLLHKVGDVVNSKVSTS